MTEDLSPDQLARISAEDEQRRLAYLYEATSTLFSEPLEVSRRLTRLAQLLVPDLGDWCWIDLVNGAELRRAVTHHWNATRVDELPVAAIVHRYDLAAISGASRVVRTGVAEMIQSPTHEASVADAPSGHIRSVLRIPLRDAASTIGVVSIGFAESNRSYRSVDVDLVQAVAVRAGWALEAARQYERATRAIAAREDVLAVVAHDLRGPLGTMLLGVEALRTASNSGTADRVVRAGQRMEQLIRDLLDWSSIESGHLSVNVTPISGASILADAFDGLEPPAKAKRLRLAITPLDQDVEVACDRARTFQVIANLVGNAIKFTPSEGTISLRAEIEPGYVRFVVEDQGPGIAPEHLPRVFERYWQAEAGTQLRHGIGLGLAIASGIVAAQGGTITVTSPPGAGARFSFTIPRTEPSNR